MKLSEIIYSFQFCLSEADQRKHVYAGEREEAYNKEMEKARYALTCLKDTKEGLKRAKTAINKIEV